MSKKRINFWIDEEDLRFLESMDSPVSFQIRTAIKNFIRDMRGLEVAASQSERGDSNG